MLANFQLRAFVEFDSKPSGLEPSCDKALPSRVAHRVLKRALLFVLLLCSAGTLSAAPPSPREALPGDWPVAVIDVHRPTLIRQSAYLKNLHEILRASRSYKAFWSSPHAEPVTYWTGLLDKHLGPKEGESVLDLLGDEGMALAVGHPREKRACLIVSVKDEQAAAELPDKILTLVREVLSQQGVPLPDPVQRLFDSVKYSELGELRWAVAGNKLCLSTRPDDLKGILDRLEGRAPMMENRLFAQLQPESGEEAILRLTVDANILRKEGAFPELLKLPQKDYFQVQLLGGWLDQIHNSDWLRMELRISHEGIAGHFQTPMPAEKLHPAFTRFFATGTESAAPLPQIPGRIWGMSFCRDFGSLWDHRQELVEANAIILLEDGDRAIGANLQLSFIELLTLLGPHHRMVAAQFSVSPYKVSPPNRIGSIAYLVDLKDEKRFKEKVLPGLKKIFFVVSVSGGSFINKTITHNGSEIFTLKYAEDAATKAKIDRNLYNFDPAMCVSDGHFIVASSSAIVKQILDDLKTPRTTTASEKPYSETQELDFSEVSIALKGLEEIGLRAAVLNEGLTLDEVAEEQARLHELLKSLGQVTVRAGFDTEGYRYRLRLEKKTGNREQ